MSKRKRVVALAETLVTCPICLGQGKRLDFATGWKALDCAGCAGSGQVTPEQAEALRERLRVEQEAAQAQAAEGGVFGRT